MTNSKISNQRSIPSAIGRLAYLNSGKLAAIALCYSVAGWVIDYIPFPGLGLIHQNVIAGDTQKGYAPSGNSNFKALDLHHDVSGVSQEEERTARELAGSDKILTAKEIKSACNALAGRNDQIDSLNNVILDIKNKKIPDVRVSSWNVNGCSQEVSK